MAVEGIDEQARPALARGARLSSDRATGEPVLLFPEGVVHLSSTAQEILSRCDGQKSVGAIIAALCEEYEASEPELRVDVLECLTELGRRKLVVFS
ncbi:MAG TPA: pyrroloquinoline quinone biosynthesis peptide chaperone PqqD [Verrucomicrobiae bacterium]|nr:pyrroloquinoline quinone biosynthesis peptide chaperone PqqD [Verrucomicrobiae bacterium]